MYPRIISESDNIIICSNNSKELFKLFFLIKINERINFIEFIRPGLAYTNSDGGAWYPFSLCRP